MVCYTRYNLGGLNISAMTLETSFHLLLSSYVTAFKCFSSGPMADLT